DACTRYVGCPGRTSSNRWKAARTPSAGERGVLSTLTGISAPPLSSAAMRSVKVPPTSTPIRTSPMPQSSQMLAPDVGVREDLFIAFLDLYRSPLEHVSPVAVPERGACVFGGRPAAGSARGEILVEQVRDEHVPRRVRDHELHLRRLRHRLR